MDEAVKRESEIDRVILNHSQRFPIIHKKRRVVHIGESLSASRNAITVQINTNILIRAASEKPAPTSIAGSNLKDAPCRDKVTNTRQERRMPLRLNIAPRY